MFFRRSFILVIFMAFITYNKAYSRTLKVCIEPRAAFPIYVEKGKERSERPGLYFEMFKLLKQKMGVNFKVKRRPFKRCLRTLKSGKVDLLASASYKKSREEFGVFPLKNKKLLDDKRIGESAYYLYHFKHKRSPWDNKGLKSIKGVVGVQLGFSIAKDLKESNIKVKEIPKLDALLTMLRKNRLNSVAMHESDGDIWLKKRGFENLKKSSIPLKKKNYYLLISHKFYKNNRSLSEKIWKNLAEIRSSNRYQKIKSKYFEKGRW